MHWVILASTFGRYSNHIIDALLGDRLLFRSKGGKSKMLSHKSPRQSLMQKRAKNCSTGVQHCAIMIPCVQVGFGWEIELSHRIAVNTCDFYVMFTFLVIKHMQSLFYSQFSQTKTSDGFTASLFPSAGHQHQHVAQRRRAEKSAARQISSDFVARPRVVCNLAKAVQLFTGFFRLKTVWP